MGEGENEQDIKWEKEVIKLSDELEIKKNKKKKKKGVITWLRVVGWRGSKQIRAYKNIENAIADSDFSGT